MPTDYDLDQLRAILRWSATASVGDTVIAQALRQALARAIVLVEEREADTVVQMSLIAMMQSHARLGPNDWICTDRSLRNWALAEIQKRVGPLESTNDGKRNGDGRTS